MTGCAEWQAWSVYIRKSTVNIQEVVEKKENLVGLTSQQIIDRFGATNDVNTSYNTAGKTEFVRYTYVDPLNNTYSFRLTLTNDVVTSVDYD